MRTLFLFLFCIVAMNGWSQTICDMQPEGGTVILTAPANATITSIDFASYGTPNGTCGGFTIGTCHAANSQSICASVFVGHQSASISATNGVFGDPCGGTVKRLYIQATYSFPLPLNIVFFIVAKSATGKANLIWETSDELNTSRFIVQRSPDGTTFSDVKSLNAGGNGNHNYQFTDASTNLAIAYYRLKMIDEDGKFNYSKIIRFDSHIKTASIVVKLMQTAGTIRVISTDDQLATILNSNGQVMKTVKLLQGEQLIFVDNWAAGLYFIKTADASVRFLKP